VYDITASWPADASPNVNTYTLTWMRNGAALPPVTIPQSAALDATGYTADFNSNNPTVTLAPGDVVTASVVANDTVDSLNSTPTVSTPLTIPIPPPVAPVPVASVTLTSTGP